MYNIGLGNKSEEKKVIIVQLYYYNFNHNNNKILEFESFNNKTAAL